jgi:hypothetical protein
MRGLLPALLIAALAAPGFASASLPGAPTSLAVPGDRDSWVEKIRAARDELARARAHYESVLEAYRQMKHHRKLRGAKRKALVEERDAAHGALLEAERRLEEVLESARRAGVPPGWVRDAMEPKFDAKPADQSD